MKTRRRTLAGLVLMSALTPIALAHGGKTHRLMGTVNSLHEDHLTVVTTEGKEAAVELTADTKYEMNSRAADRSALVEGVRVSIQLAEDDRTAVRIKIGAGGERHRH